MEITSLRFIDNYRFVACTNKGFAVFDSKTAELKNDCKIPGGVAICKPYKNSNYFYFVGTGCNEDFPSTKLCIWNAETNSIFNSVPFSDQIIDLLVEGDWIAIVFENSFKLYNYSMGFEDVVAVVMTQTNTQ